VLVLGTLPLDSPSQDAAVISARLSLTNTWTSSWWRPARREAKHKQSAFRTNSTPNSTPEPHQSYINFHTELALLLPLLHFNCTIRLLDSRAVSLVVRASLRCLIRRCDTSVGLAANKLVARRATFRRPTEPCSRTRPGGAALALYDTCDFRAWQR
jgi:hypothetical protein